MRSGAVLEAAPDAAMPFNLVLPGRTSDNGVIQLCHARPWECSDCLTLVAMFLAEETGWDMQEALSRPLTAYQAELGAYVCSLMVAADLRHRTITACVDRHMPRRSCSSASLQQLREDLIVAAPYDVPPEAIEMAVDKVFPKLTEREQEKLRGKHFPYLPDDDYEWQPTSTLHVPSRAVLALVGLLLICAIVAWCRG